MKNTKNKLIKTFSIFSLFIFLVLFVTMFITLLVLNILINHKVFPISKPTNLYFSLITIPIYSLIIGILITLLVIHISTKPIEILVRGMHKLASGKYETRIPTNEYRISKELIKSFNILAEELNKTEMLKSDFINNFSHEFKTPIMSIYGFAQILNRGNISDEKKKEYLKIILEESNRLASLTTNILNLTKVENQKILTNLSEFNLSEQIRTCILMFEKNWINKNLTISTNFNEHMIYANKNMLKQVWINILDNAIKFTPNNGSIKVNIINNKTSTIVKIENSNSKINSIDKEHIFNKFYQGNVSHSSEGNGIGLAIVKKIVDLHNGKIYVSSTDCSTTFSVELKKIG